MIAGNTGYSQMVSRGVLHFPPGVDRKITVQRWFKDFEKKIDFDSMPFLRDWYKQKFADLNSGETYLDKKWRRTVAILGLLNSRFMSVDLPLPNSWVEGRPYALKTYSMYDLVDLPLDISEVVEFDKYFANPEKAYYENRKNPWELRRNLAGEFVDLFFIRIRELVNSTNTKSPLEDIVSRNRELRKLLNETMLYDSVALSHVFYKRLPEFVKEFKSKDPAVVFSLSMLQRRFVNHEIKPDFGLISGMFQSYWDGLGDLVKSEAAKKVVEALKLEVSDYLKDLLRENKRLQRKVDSYEM